MTVDPHRPGPPASSGSVGSTWQALLALLSPQRRRQQRRERRERRGRPADLRAAVWTLAEQTGWPQIAPGDYGWFEGSAADQVVFKAYLQTGQWSPQFHDAVAAPIFQDGGGTLIDVGANIGLTCIPVAARHGVRCYAFEPDPRNFLALRCNALRNGVESRVVAENLALSSSPGRLQFELSATNHGDHRVRFDDGGVIAADSEEAGRAVIEIAATTFDTYFRERELPAPVLVKIDTQGAELHVLRGMRASLVRVDHLICEFWPYGLRRAGADLDELYALLRDFPLGAVLGFDREPARAVHLQAMDSVVAELQQLARNPVAENFVDVLMTRQRDVFA